MIRVLVLGANGLIGSNVIYSLHEFSSFDWDIYACVRESALHSFNDIGINVIKDNDYLNRLEQLLDTIKPQLVINCIGIVSQNFHKTSRIDIIKLNSVLPSIISDECNKKKINFIHISTDCVFATNSLNNDENSEYFANDLCTAEHVCTPAHTRCDTFYLFVSVPGSF